MKTAGTILFSLVLTLMLAACGGVDDNQKISLGTKSYQFTPSTAITLPVTQEQGFTLTESVATAHDEIYIIEDNIDLDALNATLTASEQLDFTDLSTHTYFLIRDFYCDEYYELTGASYTAPTLTITLEHFLITGQACATVVVEPYLVFKAAKAP